MKIHNQNSGFLVVKANKEKIDEINAKLQTQHKEYKHIISNDVLFVSFKPAVHRNLWRGGKSIIVYDVDLTNIEFLNSLIETNSKHLDDTGHLLWLLYEKYGIDFVDKLRGSFSFAIWDDKLKDLFVITDFFGIKPVVYLSNNDSFCAASKIRHILQTELYVKQINPDAVFHYLFFQAVCSPLTIYKDIHKLEPGKGIRLKDNQISQFVHYDIKYQPDRSIKEADWLQSIYSQVEQAVNVFVPISEYEETGCFLSGGTDSSSVAGFYTQLSGRPANTFSIGFDEPLYNELDYAQIASKKFGFNYHEYYVTPQDVLNLIKKLPEIYDEPFGNASVIPAFYCAKFAVDHGIKVLLGGDGGDEIFGGNERYVSNLIFQRYRWLPRIIRKALLEPMLSMMPDTAIFHKAKRYIRRANIPNPDRFYSYNLLAEIDPASIFQPEVSEKINYESFIEIARKHYLNAAPADDTDRLLYLDMKFTITDNDIRKVTQMVEAADLNVRYPLLDRDLVDFTCKIPPDLKVKWEKNRYIFKKAMKGFLPDPIINKSKHGMGLPVTPWFKQDKHMNSLLYDTLFNATPALLQYIRPDFIQKMKTAFETDDTTYYGDNLWVFLILEMWLSQSEI
jgi:asparagine synthase (glutamine-hydrolysing)